jgi:hypothetical protein
MAIPQFEPLTLEAARTLLQAFTAIERDPTQILPEPEFVRQALKLVVAHSDYQIFGVCAADSAAAKIALYAYLNALGYMKQPTVPAIAGVVYVKYNPNLGRCDAKPYTGDHRGVLVSCQSADEGDVNDLFGHLPLDLFS